MTASARTRGGLVALAVGAVALAMAARARSQPSPPPASAPADVAAGFDHIFHEGAVSASAVAKPSCARCHAGGAGGRLSAPGHAACFGDCHGPVPRGGRGEAVAPERQAVCTACHRPSEVARLGREGARAPARPAPPRGAAADGEFAILMSHAAHAGVARGCRACHEVPPEPGAARPPRHASGHPRCASCHTGRAGAAFAMSRCESCHAPAVGPLRGPHLERGRFAVGQRFSHQAHLRRARGGGEACAGCHAAAAAATTDAVPAPGKTACAPCHDGRAAFSLTEAACRRCHAAPATVGIDLAERRARDAAPRAQFSHASHAGGDCKACHALARDGEPGPVGSGHEPCADSGCHAEDFGAAEPRICTTCHVRGEPWRDLHLDPQPTGPSDFQVAFSHRAHLTGPAPRTDLPCARCHLAEVGGTFGAAAGHASCAGAGCHTTAAAPAPALGECARCHEDGAGARPRQPGRWSVRARFTHERHLVEPGAPDRPVRCTDCHGSVLEAGSIAAVRPPPKPACARCHDGAAAFKLTGHACARCHTTAR